MQSSSTLHDRKRIPPWIIVVACLMLYCLSFGPATRLWYHRGTDRSAALVRETIYAPIIWLQHQPVIGNWIYEYLDLWEAFD